jgi:hypothetical protein
VAVTNCATAEYWLVLKVYCRQYKKHCSVVICPLSTTCSHNNNDVNTDMR